MKLWAALVAVVVSLTVFDAEAAKRLGGGKSFGKQSGNVTQRDSAPPAATPGAPQQAATPAANRQPGAPAAATPSRPWGAMLGGLAAGLGLAWLASSLGLGEEFASILLIGLLVMAGLALFAFIARSRAGGGGARPAYAYQGAGQAPHAPSHAGGGSYRPENVGNDASARPWERNSMAFEAPRASGGSMIGSALGGSRASWYIPSDFDTEGFVSAAKGNFVALQGAWDRSDTELLRGMMTDEMFAEVRQQLSEREAHTGAQPNRTDVVMLEARLLGIEDLGDDYMASVEFSGMIREEPSAGPSPFREVWNMTKPKSGRSGWLVAGVQALQ